MKQRVLVLVLAMVVGSLAGPAAALANTTEAIAGTGGMQLVLLGSPFTVDVALDEFGNIASVDLGDPGFTETSSGDHKVRFSSADGATKVDVKAKKSKLVASVRSATLGDLVGGHEWSAEVFPGMTATVPFEISDDGAGNPVLALGAIAVDPAVEYTVTGPFQETDDDEAEAKATVEFTWNGFTKSLRIKVEVDHEDDDDDGGPGAKLKVELRGKDRQMLSADLLAQLAGPYTWTGLLCDGTTVEVGYTVNGDGTFTDPTVGFTGDNSADHSYGTKTLENGIRVGFDDGEARLIVQLKEKDDSTWQLKVDSKTTELCGYDDDKEDHEDDHEGDDRDDDDDSDDDDHDGKDKKGRDDHDD